MEKKEKTEEEKVSEKATKECLHNTGDKKTTGNAFGPTKGDKVEEQVRKYKEENNIP